MEESVRWTVKVSKETDIALRTFLAQSGMRKGDLSKFIEEAVRWRVLDRTTSAVRVRTAGMPGEELQALIDEAVTAVRSESSPHASTATAQQRSKITARKGQKRR